MKELYFPNLFGDFSISGELLLTFDGTIINSMNKYLIELVGTFVLVVIIALTGGNFLAVGLVLTALVYTAGYISGAHFNPAVTLAVNLRGKISQPETVKYIISQTIGASLAAVIAYLIKGSYFTPSPPEQSAVSVFLVEIIFTAALALTVLHVTTSSRSKGNQYFGLAIGSVLAAGIAAGGPISAGVYNPAVVIGAALVNFTNLATNFSNLIVYLVAQFAGAVLAAFIFRHTAPDLK